MSGGVHGAPIISAVATPAQLRALLLTAEDAAAMDVHGTTDAAVLVPLYLDDGGLVAVLTERRSDLRRHAGEISFPGGRQDHPDEDLRRTALREAEEEIDLSPDLVEVIGELEEMYIPPSGFRVSPFVGLLPPEAELVLHPDEVEAIFTVSLQELMSPRTFQKVLWTREGREYVVPVFAVQGPPPRHIWGATAAMTASLLARLGWEPRGITRVEDRLL